MNAERLLQHYERIADAPDAIARLRRFVLDLAVRGKLVPQDPNDEPASDLLERIAQEKARLVKTGKIRKDKPLPAIGDSVEFEIPATWQWARLGGITSYIQRGKSPKYATSDGSLVVSQKCVQWRGLDLSVAKIITVESLADYEDIRFIRDGDLLWNSTGTGTIGRVIRVVDPPENLVCDSHVTVVRCLEVAPEYIRTWLRSDQVYGVIEDRAAGSTNQVELTAQMALNQVVPLPPLAEQRRIVAKVDELMDLCDRLEAAREAREATRDRLAAASLARLNTPDPDTFKDDAHFVLDALPALTKRPDQIRSLRQTVLSLALQGRLSESRAARIATVGEFRTLQNGYAFKSSWFSTEGVRLLRNANIGHGQIRWNDVVKLPRDRLAEFERFELDEGDIVLTLDRPFIATGTKVARIAAADLPCLLLQRVGRFVEVSPGLDDDYLFLWITSPHFNDQIDPGRSNGVPHISSKQVEAAQIYVPSLAEQRRIVAEVGEMLALCDQLEESLAKAQELRQRLMEALLSEATHADETDQKAA